MSESDSDFDEMESQVAGEYYHEPDVVNDAVEVGANDDDNVENIEITNDGLGLEEIDPIVKEFGFDNPNISVASSEQGHFFYIARQGILFCSKFNQ